MTSAKKTEAQDMLFSTRNRAIQKLSVGGWAVVIIEDDDGHLSIHADHEDGTLVHDIGEDLGSGNSWGVRLTTEGIEDEHRRNQNL
jgi:hypothetical protein